MQNNFISCIRSKTTRDKWSSSSVTGKLKVFHYRDQFHWRRHISEAMICYRHLGTYPIGNDNKYLTWPVSENVSSNTFQFKQELLSSTSKFTFWTMKTILHVTLLLVVVLTVSARHSKHGRKKLNGKRSYSLTQSLVQWLRLSFPSRHHRSNHDMFNTTYGVQLLHARKRIEIGLNSSVG